MPLPTDEHTLTLGRDLLQALDTMNGPHPGYRAAHAKGILLSGTFTPSPEALSLTRAPHVQRASTPVTVRFSDSAGIPTVADNDLEHASPRGMAIRFQLAEHVHTDIIGVSTDGFPVRTPEEFLEFLQAVPQSGPSAPKPTPIEVFLGKRPGALKYVMTPKPIPTSFAREAFFTVTAHKFTSPEGKVRYGRYRMRPEPGTEHLTAEDAAAKPANFLFDELEERVKKGPIKFEIVVQLAEGGDVVDDATIVWPEDRPQAPFGTLTLTAVVPNNESEQRQIIFDPIPRIDGIESSGDPLLEARAAVYLMSGRRRRSASGTASA
jgi:catalase